MTSWKETARNVSLSSALAWAELQTNLQTNMKYFRVKKESDNVRIGGSHFLVQNELYTEKEVERLRIPEQDLVVVNVRKCDTYFCFGARFSLDCGFTD